MYEWTSKILLSSLFSVILEDKEKKLSPNGSTKTVRRSKRVRKRKENCKRIISGSVPKIVRKKNSVPVQPPLESAADNSEVDAVSSANGNRRRKGKSVVYEIDCSDVNMNIGDFVNLIFFKIPSDLSDDILL